MKTLVDTLSDLSTGRKTPTVLAEAAIAAIATSEETLNCVLHRLDEDALERAAGSEKRWRTGAARSLEGVPVTVKDGIWVDGVPSADGSLSRSRFIAPCDSPAVERIRRAGAIVVAKTTQPEFGLPGITRGRLFGVTGNHLDPSRTPGGSSGGAAASVGAGVAPIAIGSDAGGSVRIPAALSGLVGFKPSYGLVPEHPGASSFPSLSSAGVIAATMIDASLAASVICDRPNLARCSGMEVASVAAASAMVLGEGPTDNDVALRFDRVTSLLVEAGASLSPVDPTDAPPGELWFEIATAECLGVRGVEWREKRDELDPYTIKLLSEAQDRGIDMPRAKKARLEALAFLEKLLTQAGADILVTPTMECEAWAADRYWPERIGGQAQSADAFGANLFLANLIGAPAASIPMGVGNEGMPLGLQVLGRPGADELVVGAALAIERALATAPEGA